MKMRGWGLLTVVLNICLWQMSLQAMAAPVVADKADVRVLIDVSGSMKQNDPDNLRRPALRLLVGLLPKDTRAGVWTFGQYVNMQIPLGQVDNAWKQKARQSSQKIGSPGQFTNIEQALKRSTEDWSGPSTSLRRSVVLLTDGMVDISKNRAKNQASRQRILSEILPRLQQRGVAIHTIALSKNADHELMRELAQTTGGWYEQVENADQLQKVFLRIFEKVGKPDAVPLQDNKFTIDDSITEATVLVFHKPGAEATQIVPPDGKPFTAENAPASINWHRDEGYDMLTITDPHSGEWRIRAELDPDNRVMVVSDLKMRTSELPNRLIHGQSLPYEVNFTDHDKPIQKSSFLEVMTVSATQSDNRGQLEPRPLLDDGGMGDKQAEDGVFTMQFGGESMQSGLGELVINATGRTFIREKRVTYEVVPPVNLDVNPGESNGLLKIQLLPDHHLVQIDTLEVTSWLEDMEGEQFPLEWLPDANGVLHSELDLAGFSGVRRIAVQATGKTLEDEAFAYLDSPIEVEGLMPPPQPLAPPVVEQPLEMEQAETVTEQPPMEEEKEQDWTMTSIWFGLINLILLAGLGVGFWLMRQHNKKSQVQLVDEVAPAAEPVEQEKAA